MHKLDRTVVPTPTSLGAYRYPGQCWDDVTADDKREIRNSLEQMQGRRCAYCEGSLDELGYHIEHFRSRQEFPALTFAWSNLYWSCDEPDSCGRYKDHGAGAYAVADLVEPCVEDPDRFFRFRSDGTISIRAGLNEAEDRKAQETLRIFNLNPHWGRLRNMRKRAVSGYLSMVNGATGFSADDLREFFHDELREAATQPFYTAIRHVLTEP